MRLFHYFRRFYHCFRVSAVNLYGYGAFLIVDIQLLHRFTYRAYQCICRYKFGIYHISTELLAHQAKSGVCYIFHRSQENRVSAQVYISNLHCCMFIFGLQKSQIHLSINL